MNQLRAKLCGRYGVLTPSHDMTRLFVVSSMFVLPVHGVHTWFTRDGARVLSEIHSPGYNESPEPCTPETLLSTGIPKVTPSPHQPRLSAPLRFRASCLKRATCRKSHTSLSVSACHSTITFGRHPMACTPSYPILLGIKFERNANRPVDQVLRF